MRRAISVTRNDLYKRTWFGSVRHIMFCAVFRIESIHFRVFCCLVLFFPFRTNTLTQSRLYMIPSHVQIYA